MMEPTEPPDAAKLSPRARTDVGKIYRRQQLGLTKCRLETTYLGIIHP